MTHCVIGPTFPLMKAPVLEPRAAPPMRRARASCDPGMQFGHHLLMALILAVALGATIFLYR